ncbi:MAG: DUF2065 domain-containing protein [Rhodospirillaceae bacterium]|nr:DUF2065 domain-containing protein [Rhodospirillaceae bacterium]MBT6137940.1 DUF2065 domain-containing protein [Rhodospirillaceae bacterium]
MDDFLTAMALVLVLEGVLYAAFPGPMKRAITLALELPDGVLRRSGLIAAFVGVIAVWLIRG